MIGVKICGLMRSVDAHAAAAAGARYGGVILAGGSPRTVTPEQAGALFAGTELVRCGVFVDDSREAIVRAIREAGLAILQLHGDESPEAVAALRSELGLPIWKAVRPRTGEEFARAAHAYAGIADGLLLDGWSAKARGGTGTPFPWHEVARLRRELDPAMELIVAGGLHPDNVGEIIRLLEPDVVDVSSGVESAPGCKEAQLIEEFATAAHAAAAQQGVR